VITRRRSERQVILNIVLFLFSCFCFLPFLLLVAASITDEQALIRNGYSFFPSQFNFTAYEFLLKNSEKIIHAYGITVLVTVVGTVVGLAITALIAYPISRADFPFRSFLSFYVFFTMLFNGGLVPTYLLYTNVLNLKNSLFALIIPILLVNGFFIILMRTFFSSSIPTPVVESAYIDGAGEFKIFYKIVLPLSLPVLATVGLFQGIAYWNDWFNGLIFITDSKLYSIQNMLNRMLLDIEFMKSNTSSTSASVAANLPTRGMRMAVAVIGVIPILIAYPFFQKYFVKGLTIGAVKG
jgi:putative aldouronate transport system permease protein